MKENNTKDKPDKPGTKKVYYILAAKHPTIKEGFFNYVKVYRRGKTFVLPDYSQHGGQYILDKKKKPVSESKKIISFSSSKRKTILKAKSYFGEYLKMSEERIKREENKKDYYLKFITELHKLL